MAGSVDQSVFQLYSNFKDTATMHSGVCQLSKDLGIFVITANSKQDSQFLNYSSIARSKMHGHSVY